MARPHGGLPHRPRRCTVILVLTFLAGAVGAVARFVADAELRRRLLPNGPWATVVINVSGSLVLGALAAWAHRSASGESALAILGTGFCGGYTTFSTASYETMRLIEQRRYTVAALSGAGGLVLAVAASLLGWAAVAAS
nr:CrcB family protein [Flexivirga meconopsidis]